MSADPPRFAWKDAIIIACGIVSPLALVGSAVRTDGSRDRQLDDVTRRVERLEATQEASGKLILDRLARIETKVEVLLPAKQPTR